MELLNKVFHADIKKKSELDGHLVIEGWASTKNIDRAEEVVEPEAFTASLKTFMENPIINYEHGYSEPRTIGKALSATIDPVEGFWIKAMISKAEDCKNVVTKIKEGILRAFSIGFRPTAEPDIVDGVAHYKAIELYEVSVVSIPCNRESLFSIAKGLKYGNDLVVPYDQLVKEVEELKLKIIGAPGPVLETVNNQPDGKVAPVTIEPIPEPRYVKFLAELKRANSAAKIEELDEHLKDWKGNNGR